MQTCIHWTLTCSVWCAGLALVYKAARRRELFGAEEKESLRPVQWISLAVITAAGVLFMAASWNMTFKPLAEWNRFVETFGSAGMAGFLFQYLYYLAESAIILTVIMLGQRAGELFFSQGRNTFIPWGWLFCSLLWGLPHLLTKNWATAVMSMVLSFRAGVSGCGTEEMAQLCGGGGDFSDVRTDICCCEMFRQKYLHG